MSDWRYYGQEKTSGSALREAIQMVQVPEDPDAYRWVLGGRRVGFADLYPGTDRVARLGGVPEELRGMGLGKKIYGDLLRERGSLKSDYAVSDSAARVWEGMPSRGIPMTKNPEAVEDVVDGRRAAWYLPGDRDGSVFEATHPVEDASRRAGRGEDVTKRPLLYRLLGKTKLGGTTDLASRTKQSSSRLLRNTLGGAAVGGGVGALIPAESGDERLRNMGIGGALGGAGGASIGELLARRGRGVADDVLEESAGSATQLAKKTPPTAEIPTSGDLRAVWLEDPDAFPSHLEQLVETNPRLERYTPSRGEHVAPVRMEPVDAPGKPSHGHSSTWYVDEVPLPGLRDRETGKILWQPEVTWQELEDAQDLSQEEILRLMDALFTKESASTRKERDIELWEQWKRTKSPHDLQNLMKQMDGAIQSEVNRWSGAIARPVLEAKAKRLALQAFETYDPNKGAALNTHLTHRLKKLSREVYTHQDAVRLPEYKKLKVNTYLKGQHELMGQHGREPTNSELQDHLGWSPDMVSTVQRHMNPELIASEDVGAGLFERASVWGPDGEDGLVDMFYYDLDPTDKLIFEHSTGYGGKKVLSNPQLRKKTGLSQGQLSYRKRKIVDRLKELQG